MPKKKTIFLLIVCLIISTLFYGCEKKQSNEKNKFAIYFVKAEAKEKALSYGRDENGEYLKNHEAKVQGENVANLLYF